MGTMPSLHVAVHTRHARRDCCGIRPRCHAGGNRSALLLATSLSGAESPIFVESQACFPDAPRALTTGVEELAEPRDYRDQACVAPCRHHTSRSVPTRRSDRWPSHRRVPTTPTLACRKRAPASAAAGPPATDQAPEPHRVRPRRHCGRERAHRDLARISTPREA